MVEPEPKPADPELPLQRKVLYRWKAPQRFYQPLNKKSYLVTLAIVIGFMVILVLLGQYMLMASIAAVMFLVYVVGTIPPPEVEHVITSLGIETLNAKYGWEKMKAFWFSVRDEQYFLYIDTTLGFPGRVIMLLSEREMDPIYAVLAKMLPYYDLRKQGRISKLTEGVWVDRLTREQSEKLTKSIKEGVLGKTGKK